MACCVNVPTTDKTLSSFISMELTVQAQDPRFISVQGALLHVVSSLWSDSKSANHKTRVYMTSVPIKWTSQRTEGASKNNTFAVKLIAVKLSYEYEFHQSDITETNIFLANYYTSQVLISLVTNLQTEDLKLLGSANKTEIYTLHVEFKNPSSVCSPDRVF